MKLIHDIFIVAACLLARTLGAMHYTEKNQTIHLKIRRILKQNRKGNRTTEKNKRMKERKKNGKKVRLFLQFLIHLTVCSCVVFVLSFKAQQK